MAFVRAIKKPYGTYYALVENKRIDGKVRQKVLRYMGTSPVTTKIEVEPEAAVEAVRVLFAEELTPGEIRRRLEGFGLSIPSGKIRSISLTYDTFKKTIALDIR